MVALFKTTALMGLCLLSQVLGAKLLVTHFSGPLYTLDFNANAKSLKVSSQTKGCGQIPTWLHLDKDSRTVYCFDESWYGSGVLSQYTLKSDSSLSLVASAATPGNSVHGSLYGGKDGKGFVVTSEYSPSTITTYKLPITAQSKPIQTLQFTMAAPGPRPDRQDKPHPHAAFTDPSGKFLVVPDLGADLTRIFKIDANSGKLSDCPAIASLPADGPRHGVFRKNAAGALKYYTLNEISSSVGVYDVTYPSSSSGCLSLKLVQTLSNYGPGKTGLTTEKSAEIRISGDYLYATNRNDQTFGKEQDSIAIFKIGADGKLAFQELTNAYGYYPRSFSINKEGTYAAIGGQTTANVAIVKRDGATGKLGPLVANINIAPRGTYGGEDGLSSVIWDEC